MKNNILYHYTHKNALINMLKNKTIWATDYKYLNMGNIIKLLSEKIKKNSSNDIYARKIAELSCSLPINKAVFCLSEKGDMLSQWIHYGEYAIGFNVEKLNKCLESQDFHKVQPCFYTDDKLNELLSQFIEDDNSCGIDYFLSSIALLYNNGYSQGECEWRAISSSLSLLSNSVDDKWKMRITSSKHIIEYTEINIDEFFPIDRIIISSEKNFKVEKESLEKILYDNGICETEIIKSSIPFRKI
ncbi:hypothetical protein [uncultured Clostridium sp.]|uniref:hypothetical protein n=1 Tax=uncultured Clostridium sp. TaxID=59620 RepID=UPI0025DB4ACE|nr:hypothetical protein [uncultured Clostridium sp.]